MTYEIKYRNEDEMKDSGIEWLGMIPREWGVKRLKYIFNYKKGKNPRKFTADKSKIPYITTEFLRTGNTENYVESYNGLVRVHAGDLLLLWDGANAGEFFIAKDGILGSTFAKFILISNDERQYLNYYTKSYERYLKVMTYGMGIPHINSEILKNLCFFLPMQKSEQQKIANFLDIKTAQFDSIISKKEKLIEKLKEAKKSLISEVVTGKVKIVDGKLVKRRPEEMKDSGVKWLGMIPKEWNVSKLGYLFDFKNGVNASAEQYGKGIKFINVKEVIDNEVLKYNQIPSRVNISKQLIKENIVISGDVLFNRTSETVEEIGMTTIYVDDKKVVFGGFVIRGRDISRKLTSNFKKYCFDSLEVRSQIISYASGSIRKNISQNNLKNIYLMYPNKTEQILISNYLDQKLSCINNAISKTQLQIEKLKSAKQSLISEAVTGKIDLRDWEIVEGGGTLL